MALAAGWMPGMSNEEAESLSENSSVMGYHPGISMLLEKATEVEVIELLREAHEKSESKL